MQTIEPLFSIRALNGIRLLVLMLIAQLLLTRLHVLKCVEYGVFRDLTQLDALLVQYHLQHAIISVIEGAYLLFECVHTIDKLL